MTASPAAVVLVAAGVDPGGGAGLTADTAMLARLGIRTAPLVTALTVQDDAGVAEVVPVEAALFEAQLAAALRTVGPALRALKTGLVVTPAQAAALARCARERGLALVVDPLLAAGTGQRFVAGDPAEVLGPLVEAATLLTPNGAEAATLAGLAWDRTRERLADLARALVRPGRAVAVTGGDVPGEAVPAALADPEGCRVVDAPRAACGRTHGTGCAFASAAAGYIAQGLPPLAAAEAAHRFVAACLAAARGVPGSRVSPEPWRV